MPHSRPGERAAIVAGAQEWVVRGGTAQEAARIAFVAELAGRFGVDQDRLLVLVPDTELLAVRIDADAGRGPTAPVVIMRLAGCAVRYKPWPCRADTPVRRLVDNLFGPDSPLRVPRCVDRGAFAWGEVLGPARDGGSEPAPALALLHAVDTVLSRVGIGIRAAVTAGAAVDVVDCGARGAGPVRVNGLPWSVDDVLGLREAAERVLAGILAAPATDSLVAALRGLPTGGPD